MPAEKTYQDIGPSKWSSIKEAANRFGIRIEQANGKASSFGVTVQWDWKYRVSAAEKPSLRIAIVESGFLQPDEALKFIDDIIINAIQ